MVGKGVGYLGVSTILMILKIMIRQFLYTNDKSGYKYFFKKKLFYN